MAQMQNSQTVALQLEKVRDKVPLLYERDDILLTMIQQRGDVEKVSSRNMRLPLQIRPGGKAGLVQRRWRRPGPRFGHELRRGAGFSDFFPLRGGDHQAGRIRHQRQGKGHRKRRQARSGQRHGAVPRLPGQADADRRQRRAGHDRLDQRRATCCTMDVPRGAALVYFGQTIRYTTPRSPPIAARATWSPPIPFGDANHHRGHAPAGTIGHRRDRARRTHRRAAGVAVRHQVSPEQRHHRHVAQPEPRDVSVELATPRVNADNSALTPGDGAAGDQQGAQSAGHRASSAS